MMLLVVAVFALAAWLAFSWVGDLVVRHTSWVALVGSSGVQAAAGAADAPGVRGGSHARADELLRPQLRHHHRRDRDRARVALGEVRCRGGSSVRGTSLGTLLLTNILVDRRGVDADVPSVRPGPPERVGGGTAVRVAPGGVLVLTALAGHLLMFRKLRRRYRRPDLNPTWNPEPRNPEPSPIKRVSRESFRELVAKPRPRQTAG